MSWRFLIVLLLFGCLSPSADQGEGADSEAEATDYGIGSSEESQIEAGTIKDMEGVDILEDVGGTDLLEDVGGTDLLEDVGGTDLLEDVGWTDLLEDLGGTDLLEDVEGTDLLEDVEGVIILVDMEGNDIIPDDAEVVDAIVDSEGSDVLEDITPNNTIADVEYGDDSTDLELDMAIIDARVADIAEDTVEIITIDDIMPNDVILDTETADIVVDVEIFDLNVDTEAIDVSIDAEAEDVVVDTMATDAIIDIGIEDAAIDAGVYDVAIDVNTADFGSDLGNADVPIDINMIDLITDIEAADVVRDAEEADLFNDVGGADIEEVDGEAIDAGVEEGGLSGEIILGERLNAGALFAIPEGFARFHNWRSFPIPAAPAAESGSCFLYFVDQAGVAGEGPALELGRINVEGTVMPTTMNYNAISKAYSLNQMQVFDIWNGGELLTIMAPGGDVMGGFSLELYAPQNLEGVQFDGESGSLSRAGSVVQWNAGNGSQIIVELRKAMLNERVRCISDDSGSLEIPAEIFTWLPEGLEEISMDIQRLSSTTIESEAPVGSVEASLQAIRSFDISIAD